MAVGVVEARLIHEAVILGLVGFRSSGGDRLRHQRIDLLAALARQAEQHLAKFLRIGEGLGRNLLKLLLCREHHGNRVADRDAPRPSCGIRKLRIGLEPKRVIKRGRLLRVFHGQADKDGSGHGPILLCWRDVPHNVIGSSLAEARTGEPCKPGISVIPSPTAGRTGKTGNRDTPSDGRRVAFLLEAIVAEKQFHAVQVSLSFSREAKLQNHEQLVRVV